MTSALHNAYVIYMLFLQNTIPENSSMCLSAINIAYVFPFILIYLSSSVIACVLGISFANPLIPIYS
jgi:hypothetical protein